MNIICTSKTIDEHIMENTKIFLMDGNSEFKSLRLFPFTMASLGMSQNITRHIK